jgi:hypothetical protein
MLLCIKGINMLLNIKKSIQWRFIWILAGITMFSLFGCVKAVILDSPEFKPLNNDAKLIFQTDTLAKSKWYLLSSYNLRLVVYTANDQEPGKYKYFGTAILTHEENEKIISIPSEIDVYLLVEYSAYVAGVISTCEVPVCFHPKKGESYKLMFNKGSKSCQSFLSYADSKEPIEDLCSSFPKNGDKKK